MFGKIEDPTAESRTRDSIRYYSSLGAGAVSDRIRQLDQELDGECLVVAGLSGIGVFGLFFGLLGGRNFRLLTWLSLPFLFAFSLGKWSPPSGMLARWGIRSRREIDEERYALKALRGDFQNISRPSSDETENFGKAAIGVMDAVRA